MKYVKWIILIFQSYKGLKGVRMGSHCGKIGIMHLDITLPFPWVCLGLWLKPAGSRASETEPRRGPGHWGPGCWLCSRHQGTSSHIGLISCARGTGSRAAQQCLSWATCKLCKACAKARHHLCWDFNLSFRQNSNLSIQAHRYAAPEMTRVVQFQHLQHGNFLPDGFSVVIPPPSTCYLDHKCAHFSVSFPPTQQSTTVAPLPRCSPAMGGHPCAFRITVGARVVCWQHLSAAVEMPAAPISWALIIQPPVLLCSQVENGDILLNPHHHFSSLWLARCSCIHRGEALEKWQRWLIWRLLTNATGQIPHQLPSLCLTRRSVPWAIPHVVGSWTWLLDVKPG